MALYRVTDFELTQVADAIREKGGTSSPLEFPDGYVEAIENLPSSGGETAVRNDVTFYDYDGTVVAGYSASDFAQLSAMPANPSHTGLVAQGWNYSLSDAKTYVSKYGKLNIGQMYNTESGATEIDVIIQEGRLEPILTICVNGTITVDWGDNTTPDTVTGSSLTTRLDVPHTYANAGSYTISISATGNNKYSFYGAGQYTLLRKNTSTNENRVYANTIRNIRIGNNANISDDAFYACASLSTITISDSVTSIGEYAFRYCYSIRSITIPNSVTSIESNSFYYCNSLTIVTIPNSVTSIGTYAFNYCYSLSSITLPNSITSIPNYMFDLCYSISNITIPDSVTSIGEYTFRYCYSLSNIVIPNSVTSIGQHVFDECRALGEVTISDSMTSIANSMFYNCSALTDIIITDSVTSIEPGAFYGCYSLANVIIPNSVTNIGQSAFSYCYCFSKITIPDSVTSIGQSAFFYCNGVKEYHIQPIVPPTAGSSIFPSLSSDSIIYVPKGKLNDYKTATNWSTYARYMQEEP